MTAICGIDTGGTFTDLAVIDSTGDLRVFKSLSTPPDFDRGVLAALAEVQGGERVGVVAHGTTAGTNAVVEQKTSPVALLITAGFTDTLTQMRGSGRVAGLPTEDVIDLHHTVKPDPLVERDLIFAVDERVDCVGDVVVPAAAEQLAGIARQLAERGVRSVAVCFLWSFLNPAHEQLARDVLHEVAPDLQVSISSDVAPRWGEYERFVATVLNAALQPVMTSYVTALERGVRDEQRRLYLMQSNGGTITAAEAVATPLLTLHSGPVGGVMACKVLGEQLGVGDIIATDMGGTSFDVGLIHDFTPVATRTSVVRQYEYYVPAVHVESIGAGGGSIASIDPITGALRVGPESAGSVPGPVCYGRGGTRPTVTDADVVLGRLNPDNFWGGKLALDVEGARAAMDRLARPLGLDVVELAAGVVEIIDNRMADLTRAMTVRRGLDPRDFELFAYGGAGPSHVGAYARELGCRGIVIPRGNAASVWSAYGIAQADVMKVHEVTSIQRLPVPAEQLNETFTRLEGAAAAHLRAQGVAMEHALLEREADVRYHNQVYELTLPMPGGRLTEDDIEQLHERFVRLYEDVYGEGAGFKGMRTELVALRVRSRGLMRESALRTLPRPAPAEAYEPRPTGRRQVFWSRGEGFLDTTLYGGDLRPGAVVHGPAVLELPDTTVSIHPGQRLEVDPYGNFRIHG